MKTLPPEILRYCKYQPRTEKEVIQKLVSLGYNPEEAEVITLLLREKKILDDTQYAENYIRIHLDRGWGRKKILHALRLKGIDLDETHWQKWVDVQAYDRALRKALCQCRRQSQEKKVGFLLSRGFTLGEVRAFLERQVDDP